MIWLCNCTGFDPSFLRHSGIWGAADEAVLNIVQKNKKSKNPPLCQKNDLAYPLPSVSSTGDTQEEDLERETTCMLTWDAGWGKAKPYDGRKTFCSMNHSILSFLSYLSIPFVLFKNIFLRSFQTNFRWPLFGWFHCTMYSTLQFFIQYKIE
jgi:hypothetical protein